jgi:hypothetical protein
MEPGCMIPYVGDMVTQEGQARRERNPAYSQSRYLLEEFDAAPELPACRQLYCVAGFANEAYGDRRYNCTFMSFNGIEEAENTICANMPYYPHFDTWGGHAKL